MSAERYIRMKPLQMTSRIALEAGDKSHKLLDVCEAQLKKLLKDSGFIPNYEQRSDIMSFLVEYELTKITKNGTIIK